MSLPKNFDAASAEADIAAAWEKASAFAAGANASRKETFCIMIPPPNVTGSLHVGHAFNNTLQDILVRWHRMRGFDTLWQPGTDHAGIATQLVVEKKLAADSNQRRTDMSREEFVSKVWEWKEEAGGQIINQLKRLGCSCDWDREAFTMSGNFPDAVLKVFVDLYNQGLIYRGKRLVNWDPHFETAISDLEVENVETPGHMWHFKYPLAGGRTYEYLEKDEEGHVTLREERDYISIATTRPETMLGDGAVAVHPDDERYASIVGALCEIPVGPKEHRRLIPIITDEYPDPEFGSGAVKITGAHDFNDYAVAKRGGIPMYRLMDPKGAMRADGAAYAACADEAQAIIEGAEFTEASVDALNLVPDDLRGLDRFEARARVVDAITAEGLAVMVEVPEQVRDGQEDTPAPGEDPEPRLVPLVENKPIMQPYGDRSKVVIEPMLTDLWFVDTQEMAKSALASVAEGRTRILPDKDRKVYDHWLKNIEPWCISRQLWWGHQVPVWYGPPLSEFGLEGDAPQMFCAASEGDALESATKFYSEVAEKSVKAFAAHERVDGVRIGYGVGTEDGLITNVLIARDPDVLDTWFSSGLWPIGTLGWPDETDAYNKYFPTSVLVTGFDILFFWVARMMMMQLQVVGQEPFHTVYLHALVSDENGIKMSKTLGNVIDPLEIVDEYGADALRMTMTAMAALGGTLKLSRDRIKGYRNFGTKLWNAARFAEMNECHAHASDGIPQATATVNKWIIGETARVRETVDKALGEYRFNEAALSLYAHTWHVVCDWYVEFAKPLLQGEDAAVRDETRACMAWAIDQCLLMLHPIMPYITEGLWGALADRQKMLVHGDWPEYTAADLADADADAEMGWVIGLIEQIRSVRSEMNVNAGAKLPLIQLELDDVGAARMARNRALIERLGRVSEFASADDAPKGSVTLPVLGGAFCLPLADVVDVSAERARLEKAQAKLAKEMGGLKGKLSNQKFLDNAPQDVVADQRDRLAELEDQASKIEAALARVAQMG